MTGRPVTTNQYNIGLLISKAIGDDIGEPSSCSVNHNSSSTSIYWVDELPTCTDELKSIMVNIVINSVAGSIYSSGSNTDLSFHDLEQLAYKVENHQGLRDISTCTNSDMGGLYYSNKLSKSIVSSAR